MGFSELPYDIQHRIISYDNIRVPDIIALKQTSRNIRTRITSLASNHPAIYRRKLRLLETTIPTGLPKDLSAWSAEKLEAAAIYSYATEHRWRSDAPSPSPSQDPYAIHPSDGNLDSTMLPKVTVLKILPGGRFIIIAIESNPISVWDLVTGQLVLRDDTVSHAYWIASELNEGGDWMLAITGYTYHQPTWAHRSSLAVYCLKLDPNSENSALIRLGCAFVPGPREVMNPTIKGDIACGTYSDEFILGVLILDWRNNAASILRFNLDAFGAGFGYSPALFILPDKILLYQYQSLPHIYSVPMPPLENQEPQSNEGPIQVPTMIDTVIPRRLENFDSDEYSEPYLCGVVDETPSSSTSSVSFKTLASHAIPVPSIRYSSTTITCDPSSRILQRTRRLFRWSASIPNCERDSGYPYDGEWLKPLLALGHTGKRAVWLERDSNGNPDALVGFAAPEEEVAPDPLDGEEESDSEEDDEDERRTRPDPDTFDGESRLRILQIPSPGMFKDATAIGFDESTLTVAVGDFNGKVWILHYGPPAAIVPPFSTG